VTAAAAVKVQATWLVARGLNPAVPCGYSILIDAPVPKNAADMCTTAAANKAKVWHCRTLMIALIMRIHIAAAIQATTLISILHTLYTPVYGTTHKKQQKASVH
jgi:hypothetical protein